MAGPYTVAARIAAPDDHGMLAAGIQRRSISRGKGVPRHAAVLAGQKIHGKMNAVKLPPGDRQITGPGGTGTEYDGIKLREVFSPAIAPGFNPCFKDDPFGRHQIQAAIEHPFFQLEIRNAITQEPPGPIRPFEHRYPVADLIELLRAGQPGRPRTDHGHPFFGALRRRLGYHPARAQTLFQ